jgi:L-amino acid N-acyltransferase YncA
VDIRIREATEADLPAIVDIYNQSIPAGRSTADTRPINGRGSVENNRKTEATCERNQRSTQRHELPRRSQSEGR